MQNMVSTDSWVVDFILRLRTMVFCEVNALYGLILERIAPDYLCIHLKTNELFDKVDWIKTF